MRSFKLMVAVTESGGIGYKGRLPWKSLPADMAYFKRMTSECKHGLSNAIIMGRKTWESLPDQFKPLPDRLNVVLTTAASPGSDEEKIKENCMLNQEFYQVPKGVLTCSSLEASLSMLAKDPYANSIEQIFVIGGAQVFRKCLAMEECEAIYMTKVEADCECDTFFPDTELRKFALWGSSEPRIDRGAKPRPMRYSFQSYIRRNTQNIPEFPLSMQAKHGEMQYLELVQDIISHGEERNDRTGTGTLSVFGRQMRFDLRHSFPLLTTKKVFWKGVVEELLWFISGSTDSTLLSRKGVKIWDKNGSVEFLKSVGLESREEGDLGPIYGFQWRHFGAEYENKGANYSGQGIDQLAAVIETIKSNPSDRRIILSAWNPMSLHDMALPPCHIMCQFYVAHGELSCQMYQRSGDMGLGVPFNIASYALLTCMIAHVCNLKPGDFVHTLGDAHVYLNHLEPLKEQLKNSPTPFPTVTLNASIQDIDDFTPSDILLSGYHPHKPIPMQMAL